MAPQYRILALVDESNLLGLARTFNRRLDWPQIRDYLADPAEGRQMVECVIYVGLPPNMVAFQEQRERKLRFVYWLRTNGFMVVTKDGSPSEEGRYKANVDVLMAIDGVDLAVEMRPDIVVLVTGDSDFAHLALKLRRRGIKVEVAAADQTLGNELRSAASSFIDLRKLFNSFEGLRGEASPIGGDNVMDN
jgi:uncharacterized LabA/DUF88 family protein